MTYKIYHFLEAARAAFLANELKKAGIPVKWESKFPETVYAEHIPKEISHKHGYDLDWWKKEYIQSD